MPAVHVIGADDPRLAQGDQARGITIDDTTGTPGWYGASLDLDHAITSLLFLRDPSFARHELASACRPAEAP